MEEPGEQCIVVFALSVTEPASECVYSMWREGVFSTHPPLPLAASLTIHAKTTVHCSVCRFAHDKHARIDQ
jgi:hypothetical protein